MLWPCFWGASIWGIRQPSAYRMAERAHLQPVFGAGTTTKPLDVSDLTPCAPLSLAAVLQK
ncbi:MAG: hypothetical protein GXP38_14195 [Chloroflexi bacterium]|nr:hypothetical protein [Chloroflexota bacterium]